MSVNKLNKGWLARAWYLDVDIVSFLIAVRIFFSWRLCDLHDGPDGNTCADMSGHCIFVLGQERFEFVLF